MKVYTKVEGKGRMFDRGKGRKEMNRSKSHRVGDKNRELNNGSKVESRRTKERSKKIGDINIERKKEVRNENLYEGK